MATAQECQGAIERLIGRLADIDPQARRDHVPDRTIGISVLDHDVTYIGAFRGGELVDVHAEEGVEHHPQVRMVIRSDDLLALADGELNFARAWATGRVRFDASFRDLLRLRALA